LNSKEQVGGCSNKINQDLITDNYFNYINLKTGNVAKKTKKEKINEFERKELPDSDLLEESIQNNEDEDEDEDEDEYQYEDLPNIIR